MTSRLSGRLIAVTTSAWLGVLVGCTTPRAPVRQAEEVTAQPLPTARELAAAAAAGWRVEGLRLTHGAREGGGHRLEGVGLRLVRPERPFAGSVVVVDDSVETTAADVRQDRLDGLPIGRVEVLPPAEAAARFGTIASGGAVVILTLDLTTRELLPPPEMLDIVRPAPEEVPPPLLLVDGTPHAPGDSTPPLAAVAFIESGRAEALYGPRGSGGVADLMPRTGPPVELPEKGPPSRWRPPNEPTRNPLLIVDGVAISAERRAALEAAGTPLFPNGITDDAWVGIVHANTSYWIYGERGAWGVIRIRTRNR
jgi:hypothetical protein